MHHTPSLPGRGGVLTNIQLSTTMRAISLDAYDSSNHKSLHHKKLGKIPQVQKIKKLLQAFQNFSPLLVADKK
jgi:hypothetical protein